MYHRAWYNRRFKFKSWTCCYRSKLGQNGSHRIWTAHEILPVLAVDSKQKLCPPTHIHTIFCRADKLQVSTTNRTIDCGWPRQVVKLFMIGLANDWSFTDKIVYCGFTNVKSKATVFEASKVQFAWCIGKNRTVWQRYKIWDAKCHWRRIPIL